MQNYLYRGTMNGYEDILPDAVFDHKVQQSLASALSDNEITRLVQQETGSAAAAAAKV